MHDGNRSGDGAGIAESDSAATALHLLRGIVWVFVLLLAFAALGLAMTLFAASRAQNRTAIAASEKLLAAVLENEQRNLARLAKDYSNWDDAIRHLLVDFDEPWADKNIGTYLAKTFDATASIVVSGSDRTIFATVGAKRAREFRLSSFDPGMADLLRRVRANAGAEEPPPAAGFVLRDGAIEIAAASVFAREYPDKSPPLTDPLAALIVTKRLDAKTMAQLAGDYDLPGLRLAAANEPKSPAVLPLADPAKRILGTLAWNPRLPGEHIVNTVLPQIVAGLAVVTGLILLFLAQARRLTRRIALDSRHLARGNARLAESEKRRARAMKIAQAGIWEWDVGTDRHLWSGETFRIFGMATETPIALDTVLQRLHPDDRRAFASKTEAWLNIPGSHVHEFRVVRPDGAVRHVRIVAEAVVGGAGESKRLQGFVQDITQQKRLEERLREIQKMEALGNLTGGVAHEFNNLLQVIVSNLELSEIDIEEGKDPRTRLQVTHRACASGGRLIQQLLTYAGNQMIAPTTTNVADFIEDLTATLGRMIGETIRIDVKIADGLWPIFVDQGELRNALVNLVINARDAMPNGGRLEIEATNVHLDEAFSARRPYEVTVGDYVAIAVRDTGTGMSPEVMAHAFDPFFTTKEVGKGSGLGLSMVFGFVRRHSGGYVDIESAPRRGTTVRLYMPGANHSERERRTENAESAILPERPADKTILYVEDDGSVRAVVAETLHRLGYRIRCATTGAEALASLANTGNVDLVLADIVMPGEMDGLALAREIRRTRPDMPILLMTAYLDDELARRGIDTTDFEVIRKPAQAGEIAAALTRIFSDRRD